MHKGYKEQEAMQHIRSLGVLRGLPRAGGSAIHVVASICTRGTKSGRQSNTHGRYQMHKGRQEQEYYDGHMRQHKQNIIGGGIQYYESRKEQEAM